MRLPSVILWGRSSWIPLSSVINLYINRTKDEDEVKRKRPEKGGTGHEY